MSYCPNGCELEVHTWYMARPCPANTQERSTGPENEKKMKKRANETSE
jgi:hypothetical protein